MEAPLHKCWNCKEKQATKVAECKTCHFASYCSAECRDRDLFRHKVECANASKVLKCNNCSQCSNNIKACNVCYSAFYCSKKCQAESWKRHKIECERIAEEIFFIAADRQQSPPYNELPSYIGSSMAEDYLCLEQNEGMDTDQALKLLFVGVGDIRNVIRSVANLPSQFRGTLSFVINDISPHTMARNILLIYSCIVHPKSACNLVQIWYSTRLTPSTKNFLTSVLKDLTTLQHVELLVKMRHLVDITENNWKLCSSIWEGWQRLNSEGLASVCRFIKERCLRMAQYVEQLKRLYHVAPEQQVSSIKDFMDFGVLLPASSSQSASTHYGNPTLAHFNPFNSSYTSKFQDLNSVNPFINNWGFEFSDKPEMIYGVQGDCNVFGCWDYLEVKKVAGIKDDLRQMYRSYLNNVFEKFINRIQNGSIKFQIIIDGFDKVVQYVSDNDKFDRISLSSLSDYYYIPTLLEQFGPLLNRGNKHAVVISKHVKWYEFTDLFKAVRFTGSVSEVRSATFDMLARPNVLPDVRRFCAAPEMFAPLLVNSYFDTYPYFVKSLLSEVVLYYHKMERTPLSKPAMKKCLKFEQNFGLRMSDFRCERNRVIPFYREGMTRSVSLKPNTTRYLEWRPV